MMALHFEGYSDDTFGEYRTFNADHDNCADGEPIDWLVTAPNGDRLMVRGQYCPGPATGWVIGVGRIDEDDETPLPDWPMRIERSDRPYSPRLVIEVPDGSRLECLTLR